MVAGYEQLTTIYLLKKLIINFINYPSICPSSPVHAWVSRLFSAFILDDALAGWGRERKGRRQGEREREMGRRGERQAPGGGVGHK